MRPKKTFKIVCFYCHRVFEYKTNCTSMINRAYCDDCEKDYLYDKWHRGVRREEYKQYLQLVKNQFSSRKEENMILLQRRDGQLFKGETNLGVIEEEDDKFVYVRKTPLGSVSSYRKEVIKN